MDDSVYIPEEMEMPAGTGKSWFIGNDAYAGDFRSAYIALLIVELLITWGVYSINSPWAAGTRAMIAVYAVIAAMHVVYVSASGYGNYLAPDIIYLLFYTLFNMGYLFLWFFGIVPTNEEMFYEPLLYPKTIFIVNIGLIAFLLGYELAARDISRKPDHQLYGIPDTGWETAGLLIMVFILAVEMVYIFFLVGVNTFRLYGYVVYTNIERFTSVNKRLWVLQSAIFPAGFALYIIGVGIRQKKLFSAKLGLILFITQITLWAMQGARTAAMMTIMVLVFARHYLIKPFRLRTLIILMVSLVVLFANIGIVRNITALDIGKMLEELRLVKQTGVSNWYDPFVEMGSSVRTINMTVTLVPGEFPYWYGRSYINSLLHVVPLLQGFVASRVSMTWSMNVSDWLTSTLSGPGASGLGWAVAGEGYINFAMPGVVLHMLLLGVVLRKIYLWFVSKISPARCLVFLTVVGLLVTNVRNTTNTLFAPLIQTYLLGLTMTYFFREHDVLITSDADRTISDYEAPSEG